MTVEVLTAPQIAEAGTSADGAVAEVRVEAEGHVCTVIIGGGLAETAAARLRAALPGARRAVVAADGVVDATAGAAIAAALTDSGLVASRCVLPPGEATKTIDEVAGLWRACRAAGLTRHDAVVAVGGGAATDTAGFAAATYSRGTPLVNVPTTLLAMVDAAIGGKVAVDFDGIKNAVGTFHHPRLVVCDIDTLATLPAVVMRQGLAEIIKAAILASPSMLEVLETAAPGAEALPATALLRVLVKQSVRIKAAYVTADPRDHRERHSLNLGHTFAHAIESASAYAVPHGDAVAMGLVAAARLGEERGITPAGTARRVADVLSRWGLPVRAPAGLAAGAMAAAMSADKKRDSEGVNFIVPAPGGCAVVRGVDPAAAVALLLTPV